MSTLATRPSPTPSPTLGERLRASRRALSAAWDALRFATIARASQKRREREWQERINDVLSCPDEALIPRHPDAGKIIDGAQIMHNGLRIVPGSYYGWRGTRMFAAARGVHEPQEERVFAAVLPHIRPGSVMLELGAYWAFYSMWFARSVPDATCVLVEPEADNLDAGLANLRLNGLRAHAVRAMIGATAAPKRDAAASPGASAPAGIGRLTSVDELADHFSLERIHILHSDIQGFEGDMLRGASRMLAAGRIDFVFISTHTPEVHAECRDLLHAASLEMIAEADMNETYSFDGLLVAQRPGIPGPGPIAIAKKPKRI